ncbi:FlgB family protein [Aestuariibius insulae]|uniref:FlgB family protein n=1 Tax=Aestuariibius insulae TaxID=2058287 RepID=UPI00345E2715
MYDSLTLFDVAHQMARHAGKHQALVAQNMANADTPGYRSQTVEDFRTVYSAPDRFDMRATRQEHFGNDMRSDNWRTVASKDVGTMSPNGNNVSLETEMLRSVDAQRQHNRALAIYSHAMTVLRVSLGRA